MATVAELEKKLDEHIASNDARFDKLDTKLTTYQIETIKEMVKNTTLLEQFGGTLSSVLSKVEVLKDKPAKQMDVIYVALISSVVGGAIGFIINLIAK